MSNLIEAPVNFRYDKGIRLLLDDDGTYSPEDQIEFMARMKKGEDVLWTDLERAEQVLPAFREAKTAGKDIREALEGIACGGGMKEVVKSAGFPYWQDFDTRALRRAKCIKQLYLAAKREREFNRLMDAEDALHDRAVVGVQEPIINHLGKIVGYKTKYSDSLLALQLKALNPDKYADRRPEGLQGVVVNVEMGLRPPPGEEPALEVSEQFTGLHNQMVDEDGNQISEEEPPEEELL